MTIREAYLLGWVYGLLTQAINEDTRPDLAAPNPYSSLNRIFKRAREKSVISNELEKQIALAFEEINGCEITLNKDSEKLQPLEFQGRWLIGYFRGLYSKPLPDMQIDIKAMQKQKGLSQSALARHLGVAQTVVSKWETGKSKPNQIMLDKLQSILA